MSARLIGVLAAMVALLAAGLATGTRVYYLLFFILLGRKITAAQKGDLLLNTGRRQDTFYA